MKLLRRTAVRWRGHSYTAYSNNLAGCRKTGLSPRCLAVLQTACRLAWLTWGLRPGLRPRLSYNAPLALQTTLLAHQCLDPVFQQPARSPVAHSRLFLSLTFLTVPHPPRRTEISRASRRLAKGCCEMRYFWLVIVEVSPNTRPDMLPARRRRERTQSLRQSILRKNPSSNNL